MPSRTFPYSDIARLNALEKAKAKADAVAAGARLISAASFTTLGTLLPQLQTAMSQRGQALGAQGNATAALQPVAQRLRMFNSHFFQSLNNAIDRGVLTVGDRGFFQLDLSQASVPLMASDAELQTWGQRIVDGEAARAAAMLTPVLFPSAAEVAAVLTEYRAKRIAQSARQDAYDAAQEAVDALRAPVDALIRDMWDEIEFALRREEPSSLRREARLWGVIYVSRSGEPADNGDDDGGVDNGGGGNSVPAAPGAPELTNLGNGQVGVTWSPMAGALSFKIYQQNVDENQPFVEVGAAMAGPATLTGLLPGATIRVRLTALNEHGESQPGPYAEIIVSAPPP